MVEVGGRKAWKWALVLGAWPWLLVPPGQAGAVSSRQLVEIADFGSPVVSPDGRLVAYRVSQASIERNTDDTVWYVQRMDGTAPPRRVADGGVPLRDSAGIPVPAEMAWSPDSRWVFYRARLDGRVAVWRVSADGAVAEPVTDDAADVEEFALDAAGTRLTYRVGLPREAVRDAEEAEYDRGIRIDRAAPLGQGLFRSGLTEGRLATQRLGQVFNRVPLTAATATQWKAVGLDAGTRDAVPADAPAAPSLPAVLQDLPDLWQTADEPGGDRVAFLTRSGERTAQRRVELGVARGPGARDVVMCRAAACTGAEISGIQWRPGSEEVLFTVTRYTAGFAQSIHRWDVASGAVHPVAASNGMFAGEGRWGPGTCGVSAAALACVTAEANRPPRLERIDLATGARQVLFDPNEVLARDLGALDAELLRWSDADGQVFSGQLYPARRIDGRPPPLFVTYYRCMGFVRGGAGDEWPLAVLAEHGIATLCINAPSFSADAAERYGVGLSAVESAVDLLAAEDRIDRTRVGMGGLSFGSEVTMWTLIHSDLLAAASLASPTTSPMYYLLGSNIGEEFLSILRSNWQLGAPEETPADWQRISPTANLDRIRAPVLMQLAEQETMHGLDYMIPLMRDGRADIYVFPHAPHNKFQPRHKLAVYERNLDWFRFWLLGEEDAAPAKAAQYAQWRAMRERLGEDLAAR
ncbi:Atxe2 family lasso peptide isopeptidase [Coralloluteibacterium stylophorae]|uniref:Atxe2 family lasso peptide isopeptidase n=1 Tax=Coralloluteibacterium stylophorae TaxID=1776034 RepID=A0A8J8AZP7_9GAMM|nr:Atxe2 family lasso peptide isopeptidase [Coralloluteibacterium stylophorae]MBS7456836.1 Atxe2 family lasso peptide isopeptidase [Coralloluteibacterium stylophorae]